MHTEERDYHTNTHHIIPRSRNGGGRKLNTVMVDLKWHTLDHKIFRNGVFHEKIRELLCWSDNGMANTKKGELMRLLLTAVKENQLYIGDALRKPLNKRLHPPRGDEKEKADQFFSSKGLIHRIYAIIEWDLPVLKEPTLEEILTVLGK